MEKDIACGRAGAGHVGCRCSTILVFGASTGGGHLGDRTTGPLHVDLRILLWKGKGSLVVGRCAVGLFGMRPDTWYS